jgi:hypothetical protein
VTATSSQRDRAWIGDSSRFSNYGNYGNSGDYGNFTGLSDHGDDARTCPGLPWITGDPSRRAADPERFFPGFQIMAIMAIPAIMAISRGFRWRR